MNTETLSENWVNFTRIYCKEGYIDRWIGDSINDPNNDTKSMFQLNSITEFYRFNNSKWYSKYDFKRYFLHDMLEEIDIFTADEIFKYYKL